MSKLSPTIEALLTTVRERCPLSTAATRSAVNQVRESILIERFNNTYVKNGSLYGRTASEDLSIVARYLNPLLRHHLPKLTSEQLKNLGHFMLTQGGVIRQWQVAIYSAEVAEMLFLNSAKEACSLLRQVRALQECHNIVHISGGTNYLFERIKEVGLRRSGVSEHALRTFMPRKALSPKCQTRPKSIKSVRAIASRRGIVALRASRGCGLTPATLWRTWKQLQRLSHKNLS